MKRRGLVFLLLSGCVLVSHLQPEGVIRRFHAIREMKNWTDAQRYCREKFTDLATIQDQAHNTEAQQVAGSGQFWIGLKSDWEWSEDNQQLSTKTWFNSWAPDEPKLKCATITEDGSWFTQHCDEQLYLMCYNADGDKHILVKQRMTWVDAQKFCRSVYTDLSSIRTGTVNRVISSLLQHDNKETNTAESSEENVGGAARPLEAWIGLHVNFWKWSDRSTVTHKQPVIKQASAVTGTCMSITSAAEWYSSLCSDKHFFLCHSDVRTQILRSVKVRLSGGSADLNDPALQDAILQQLKQKLEAAGIREEVKLRWRRQPDGKSFHKEEKEEKERAAPSDREQKTVCDNRVIYE
ncbi:hypothetical protein ABVT39_010665 [Epinephelus coioides]